MLKISSALYKENLKMYWFFPVFAFLAYFSMDLLGIITKMEYAHENEFIITRAIENDYAGYIFLSIVMPLVAACIFMNFYHNPKKSFALHGQPYSKSRLFNTEILTGWTMMIVPVILIGVIYMAIVPESFGIVKVFKWILVQISFVSFYYSLYILAGSLVGTTWMQILGSGVLFCIVPAVIGLGLFYFETFYYGYCDSPEWLETIALKSNPALAWFAYGKASSVKSAIFYLVLAALMMVLARFAYGKAKLEKVGDSMIFSTLEEIITWVLTLVGGSGIGLIVYSTINETKTACLIGAVIGGTIVFAFVKILMSRSIKIFNRKNGYSLMAGLSILIIFVLIGSYDITGFAKRIPNEKNIKGVYVSDFTNGMNIYKFYEFYGITDDKRFESENAITDEEVIKDVLDVHKYIVENKCYELKRGQDTYMYSGMNDENMKSYWDQGQVYDVITVIYELNNGNILKRRFTAILDEELVNRIDKVVSNEKVKQAASLKDEIMKLGILDIRCTVYSGMHNNTYTFSSPDAIEKILDARERDMEAIDYINGNVLAPAVSEADGNQENAEDNTQEYIDGEMMITYKGSNYDQKPSDIKTLWCYFDNTSNPNLVEEIKKKVQNDSAVLVDEYDDTIVSEALAIDGN